MLTNLKHHLMRDIVNGTIGAIFLPIHEQLNVLVPNFSLCQYIDEQMGTIGQFLYSVRETLNKGE